MTVDETFMSLALALGRKGLGNTAPNPAVGCVIVKDGSVIGRGYTQPGGRPHAETEALKDAGEAARGATAYVTLEPCSHYGRTGPCADALARAGIARVVGAMRDPDPRVAGRGFAMLRNYGLSVTEGVCETEAMRGHAGHVTRILLGRPFVTLKMAISADGRVAGAGGIPVRITGPEADEAVQLLRAQSDAIAVGAGTVAADNPRLTVRLPGYEDASPLRIVFDGKLSLADDISRKVIAGARQVPTWFLAGMEAPVAAEMRLVALGVDVLRADSLGDHLRLLGARGLTRLLVEGGPTLAASLVEADLIDQALLFHSAHPIGEGPAAFSATTRERLEAQLPVLETSAVGRDILFTRKRG